MLSGTQGLFLSLEITQGTIFSPRIEKELNIYIASVISQTHLCFLFVFLLEQCLEMLRYLFRLCVQV